MYRISLYGNKVTKYSTVLVAGQIEVSRVRYSANIECINCEFIHTSALEKRLFTPLSFDFTFVSQEYVLYAGENIYHIWVLTNQYKLSERQFNA